MADVGMSPEGARRIVKPIVVSRIVSQTFRVWFTSLPQLLVIAAIVCVPFFLLRWFLEGEGGWKSAVVDSLPIIQVLAVTSIGQAFAIRFVFQRLRGDPTDLGRSITVGLKRVGAVAGIDLILSIPMITYLAVVLYVARGIGQVRDSHAELATAGELLVAMLAFSLFQMIVVLVYPVAAPAAVVEGSGVFASLRRSALLTKGRRTTIFGISVVYGLIWFVPGGTISFIILMMHPGVAQFLARAAFDLAFASLACVLPIVLYHDLRDTREGFAIDDLAAVFD